MLRLFARVASPLIAHKAPAMQGEALRRVLRQGTTTLGRGSICGFATEPKPPFNAFEQGKQLEETVKQQIDEVERKAKLLADMAPEKEAEETITKDFWGFLRSVEFVIAVSFGMWVFNYLGSLREEKDFELEKKELEQKIEDLQGQVDVLASRLSVRSSSSSSSSS